MARNGSGTYNRAVSPYVAGTTITAATVNSEMDDIATALTQSLSRDGQSPPTANIPMGNFRITDLANAIANTDAAPLGQVVAKAGDTMTGPLGFAVGTAALPGVFPAGDTNTGFFQAAAAPDTLSVSVGGTEVARFGAGGFMRLAAGTAAAPAYSFSGDTDTGIFNNGSNILAMAVGGYQAAYVSQSAFVLDNKAGDGEVSYFARTTDASASNVRATNFLSLNESSVPLTTLRSIINTDGSGNIELYATPAGSRASDRRVLRATIPGSGPVMIDGRPVGIRRSTAQATTSGTAIDFLNIPAGARRITLLMDGVSLTGTDNFLIQIGAGSFATSGYTSQAQSIRDNAVPTVSLSTAGFIATSDTNSSARLFTGRIELFNSDGNDWLATGILVATDGARGAISSGKITLGGTLDRFRLTRTGTDTFDAGKINLLVEYEHV